jgi:hypothetical protein
MAPSMLDMNEDDAEIMLHVELAEGRATYALESCTRVVRETWTEDNDGRPRETMIVASSISTSDAGTYYGMRRNCLKSGRLHFELHLRYLQTSFKMSRHAALHKSDRADGFLHVYLLRSSLLYCTA